MDNKVPVVFPKQGKRKSAVQSVIDNLTEAMIQGKLKPGDRIPTEMELAEQFCVSRNTIREAVKMLVFLGVLEIHRPEGTFVSNGFSDAIINPMIYGIILRHDTSYLSLMELREMIEVGVVRLAIEKADDKEVHNLQITLDELKDHCLCETPDIDGTFSVDSRFHDEIMEMGHNSIVAKINAITRVLTYEARYDTVKRMLLSGRGQELYQAHERIYETIVRRDLSNLNQTIRETYFL